MTESDDSCRWSAERRAVLGAGVALVPFLAGMARADEAGPASLPPQPGDRFAFLTGDKKGQIIKTEEIPLGGPQIQAYPIDPKSGVVRDGSRLNLVLLARFDPATFDDATRARSADGVVAYSGVCTHQGCAVNMWASEAGLLFCSCHGSIYDPRHGAEVIGGPAPRALPSLALKVADGAPVVAEGFNGSIGPSKH